MDIVFLAAAIIAAIVLSRPRALVTTVGVWALCVAAVGWGPAHNSNVHVREVGFWAPWVIVLGIGLALVAGISFVRTRRAAATARR